MATPLDLVTVLLPAFLGYGVKWAQDAWTARTARRKEDQALWSLHKQQFHRPLLDGGRQLERRLVELTCVYKGRSSDHSPGSISGDFRELYLLRRDHIPDLLDSDGNQPRRNDNDVQKVRKRMCYELNFATSSLYWTARYLAQARLVHLHLSGGGSSLRPPVREELDRLIADVGASLQGPTGAGMFSEQQESIAEMMVDAGGRVLSHYDFRRRLLELPGWEQFTALLYFYISEDDEPDRQDGRARLAAKMDNEVRATIRALARLRRRLDEICGWNSARGS